MARLLVFAAVAALVIAFPVTHEALAGNDSKVKICHVNSANKAGVENFTRTTYRYTWDWWYGWYWRYWSSGSATRTYVLGKVIEVDDSALETHLAHGDSQYYAELTEDMEGFLTTLEDKNDTYGAWVYYGSYPWYYYRYRDYWYDNVNAVIKNANCWFYG